MPLADAIAAIRRISVKPPALATSGLRYVESAAIEEVFEVEPGELALTRRYRNDGRLTHFGESRVIVWRYRLLEPGDVIRLQLPSEPDRGCHVKRTVGVHHQLDILADTPAGLTRPCGEYSQSRTRRVQLLAS